MACTLTPSMLTRARQRGRCASYCCLRFPSLLALDWVLPRADCCADPACLAPSLRRRTFSACLTPPAPLPSPALQAAVDNFRSGKTWVLVATDLIGRGMDFLGVNTVRSSGTLFYVHVLLLVVEALCSFCPVCGAQALALLWRGGAVGQRLRCHVLAATCAFMCPPYTLLCLIRSSTTTFPTQPRTTSTASGAQAVQGVRAR